MSHHYPNVQADAVRRLARAEGHVRALREMVERGEPCADVLIQVAAVQGALNRVAGLLLEDHIGSCLADEIAAGRREEALSPLRKAIRQFLR